MDVAALQRALDQVTLERDAAIVAKEDVLGQLRVAQGRVKEAEEERSKRMVGSGRDKLMLRGCRFQGYHGVMNEEKSLGQKFVVDMDAWLDLKKAGESDKLEHSVSYADAFRTIQNVVEGRSRDLLESVAEDIACSVLKEYPRITDVRVRIYKFSAPVVGFFDKLGVEIYRTSSDCSSKA